MATKYDIFDESAPLPESIYIDTNFIIALFLPKSSADLFNQGVCESFLEKLKRHKVKLFTSDITFSELYHKIIDRELKKHPGSGFKDKYKTDPSRIVPCFCELDNILKICNEQGIYPIRVNQETNFPASILENIKSFQLLSNDAFHYSTAKEFGISSIVSLDSDFGRITDNVTIYTLN